MKKIITLFIIGMCFTGNTQITYSQNDGPRIGLKIFTRSLTDVNSFDLNQLMETGGNKTWDISGTFEEKDVTEYIAVDGLSFKDQFPGSNMAVVEVPNPDDSYVMYERNTSGLYLLGFADAMSEVILTPKYTLVPFPLIFGSNYQNNSSAEFKIDTINVKMNIQSNATVDAWGMLTTNDGTYPVLKMKTVQIRETTFSGIPFGATSFTYAWLTSGLGNPLGSLEITEDETFAGLLNDTALTYTYKQEVVSNNDLANPKFKLSISPNPVNDHVIIQCKDMLFESATYSVINTEGKTIMDGKLNANEILKLNMQQLASGNYLVQMILDKKTMLFDIISKK